MRTPAYPARRLVVVTIGAFIWTGCSDPVGPPSPVVASSPRPQFTAARAEDVRAAIAAQERHSPALLRMPGVVGTAVGVLPSGRATIRIFLEGPGGRGLPTVLENIPVTIQVTGRFMALSDPTTRLRPAPIGFSVGHPSITAGTMGALVRNAASQLFALSNNHVLANQNTAVIGDAMLQPGPFDGGTAGDQIGTLAAFKPIDFSGGTNTMDAAIAAITNAADVSNSTPTDDGYGVPNPAIFGDGNGDGIFDDKTATLGLFVQKYGRTTKLTKGAVTGINARVEVCYEVLIIFCIKSAVFVDQLMIESAGFSGGGDSGSLIVTDDANKHPVALLFAGSETSTIANRIDLVLSEFDVAIDGGTPPPPTPLTDIGVTGLSAPVSITQGSTADVAVTVRNVGNQNVGSDIVVTLADATAGTTIGTQTVAGGLAPGAARTLGFSWNTTGVATGSHTLTASHDVIDENAANNSVTTTSVVNAPGAGLHVGDLDAFPSSDGSTWSAVVEVTVHDANHAVVNGATVVGSWTGVSLASDTCTTGELGGNGTCIFLAPGLRKKSVSFTVTSVTQTGQTYQAASNHDPDGDSNGTSIKVTRPRPSRPRAPQSAAPLHRAICESARPRATVPRVASVGTRPARAPRH